MFEGTIDSSSKKLPLEYNMKLTLMAE